MKRTLASFAVAAVLATRPVGAQEDHQHTHDAAEALGKVNFPTSCAPAVAPEFARAVALLHSFGYEEARRSFEIVAKQDPACAMAYWGIAMTDFHPIWAPPGPAELAAGRAAAKRAAELAGGTERERGYIGAIVVFYEASETRPHGARAAAYRDAMEALSRRLPEDHEAAIFYALAILGAAPASDPTFASQKKAAAILNGLLPVEPEHPGIAHYMIHAFDYPPLASDALPAARAYAKIAPSSPHALHMPSHIFTRLGLWQESIASNLASAEAGRRLVARRHPGAASFDTLHALDYLEYAYLQIGDEDAARKVVAEAASVGEFDEAQFAAGYAIAAIPARWALERRDWAAAAELKPPAANLPWERFAYVPALTDFGQALGAARSGQAARARVALDRLKKVQEAIAAAPVPGPYDWAAHVEAIRLAAAAWLEYAEGRQDEALRLARAAAELDEKTGKHPVTPGTLLPPRELLGDMLLEAGRPAEALAAYEASLREAPGRFNSLVGAARAAALAKQPVRSREYYADVIEQTVPGSPRPELAEARRAVAESPAKSEKVAIGAQRAEQEIAP
jgi:tetratricopeptide (TPR) repeat protein